MLERTPLYDVYSKYEGAKIIDFGGWELPVQFKSGIIEEHMAVRKNAGLFDVSHMGEAIVEGEDSEAFINWLITNDVTKIKNYQCLYSPVCYPHGGVVDDILVYKFNKQKFLLVLNASNVEKDYQWMEEQKTKGSWQDVKLSNISNDKGQIAFQGPKAGQYMADVMGPEVGKIEFFHFRDDLTIDGIPVIISKTGYTGEEGYEIYSDTKDTPKIWNKILDETSAKGVIPCGLGARDTLRFESKLPLYGHELAENITPLEANLSIFVKFDNDDFCGKEALLKQKEQGVPRTIRGCEMLDKGVPRQGYKVYYNDEEIGVVTSGAVSPMLDKFLGLVLIKRGTGLQNGDEINIQIGKKLKRAKLVKTPFYKNT